MMLIVALVGLWLLRFTLAADFIDREFARRGVQATYEVKRIGLWRQRFENLVIGDPENPDLTARWVEIELDWRGFRSPDVSLITARGVRMRGRIVDGRVTLGQVDRLLPPPSGLPFRLPDQRVNVADAAIVLDTPGGRIGISLAGRGNLSHGFRGHMAAISRGLRFRECALAAPEAVVEVAVNRHRPTFVGPASLASLRCDDDFALERPRMNVNVTLSEAFNSWRGWMRVEAARMEAGPNELVGVSGRLSLSGDIAATRGSLDVASAAARIADIRAASTRVTGDYALSPRRGDLTLDGTLAMRGVVLGGNALRPIVEALRSAQGTPVGPVAHALADALTRAATDGAELGTRLNVVSRDGHGAATFQDVDIRARSGARLRISGGGGFTYAWPGGTLRTDGDFAVSGGGLPSARFTLHQARPGAPIQGVGRVSPIIVGDSRVALGEVRFTAEADGASRIDTQAVIHGGFRGGRIDGLAIPVRGRIGGGGFAFGENCVQASFRRLELEDLVI
ncbi:MAG: hypothetical protein M3N07_04270, partial [Pseudomonadota bacterium]|nr:hypothetical protein [Pseudomonadota bacterium]